MAAGGQSDDLGASLDLFDCQICLEPMVERQPRTLSACNHTFCQLCLDKLVDRQEQIICPTCRKVTDVTDGDVTQLPRNFSLGKMKEWQESMVKKEEYFIPSKMVTNFRMCEVCHHDHSMKEASFRCNDCDVYLCETCKEKHLSIPACSGHQIVEVLVQPSTQPKCVLHGKIISFLCFACHRDLCLVCSLSDHHKGHKDQIKSLDEGLIQSKESVQVERKQLQDYVKEMTRYIEQSEEDLVKINDVLKDLESKKEEIITTYKDPTLKGLEKLKHSKETLVRQIDNIEKDSTDLNLFLNQPKRISEAENLRHSVQTTYLNLQSISFLNATKVGIPISPKHGSESFRYDYSSAVFVLKVKEGITTVIKPYDILQLSNNTALVADNSVGYVQHIDMNGHLVGRLYPFGICDSIDGITSYGDNVYIANERGITRIPLDLKEPGRHKCANIKDITSIAAIDEKRLLISTSKNQLFEFNVFTKTKKLLESDFDAVYNISVKSAKNSYKFVLTQTFTHHGNIVINGQQIVMSGLGCPRACCITEHDTILVAEQNEDRVFEITWDGKFIRNVLTKETHRIRSPCGLSLRYPYLWITEVYEHDQTGGAIKLFKFQ